MASSSCLKQIDEFVEVFFRFKERLSLGVEAHTAFVSSKVLGTVEKLGKALNHHVGSALMLWFS